MMLIIAAYRNIILSPALHFHCDAQECFFVNKRWMKAGIFFSLVTDETAVGVPFQYISYMELVTKAKHIRNFLTAIPFKIKVKNLGDFGRICIWNKRFAGLVVVVAERNVTAASPIAGTHAPQHTNAGTHKDIFTLQLCEDAQNTYHRSAIGCRGVESFRNADEVYIVRQKHVFNQIEGIFLTAGKTVQLEYDNSFQLFFFRVSYHFLHCRPIEITAAETGVRVELHVLPPLYSAECLQLGNLVRN